MNKVKCHICAAENEITTGALATCVICDADLADPKSETGVLADGSGEASYALSEKALDARKEAYVILTTKRLVFLPVQRRGVTLTGAVMAGIANSKTAKMKAKSISLDNVTAVRDGKFGLFIKAIVVDKADGSVVKMTVSKREEWVSAIKKVAGVQ